MRDISDFNLLDIKGDCFDMIIASFAQWLKGEHRFLFIDCLGFNILQVGNTLGERIYVDKGDIIAAANKNGIATDFHDSEDLDINKIVSLINEYNPLVLELDEYDCYWRKNYLKIHRKHYVLLMEYSEVSTKFKCIDTFPNDATLTLLREFVTEKVSKIICLSDTKETTKKNNLIESLAPTMQKFNNSNKFGSIWDRYFLLVEEIIASCSLEREVQGFEDVEIIFTPLIWNLKNVLFSFNQYQYFLEYIDAEVTKPLIQQLELIMQSWEIAINIFTLSIIRKDYSFKKDKVQKYLRKAIDEEKKFIDQLSSLVAT
jgi:hypothetical protein